MDFITRLKLFLAEKQLPVTQFADKCNIPRPTISQLINGRNKRVSDEIVSKIHAAFPELSVYWLMFGEGNMLHDSQEHNITTVPTPREFNIFNLPDGNREILKSQDKTIAKIVVFYNDNSYESFGPHNLH